VVTTSAKLLIRPHQPPPSMAILVTSTTGEPAAFWSYDHGAYEPDYVYVKVAVDPWSKQHVSSRAKTALEIRGGSRSRAVCLGR
jgi:hypothetical protein